MNLLSSRSTNASNWQYFYMVLVLISMSVLFSACIFSDHHTLTGDEILFPKTKKSDIVVFFSPDTPSNAFKEVGYVISVCDNEEDAVAFLKNRAADWGADAIINCEVRANAKIVMLLILIPTTEYSYIASGVAVKYTN